MESGRMTSFETAPPPGVMESGKTYDTWWCTSMSPGTTSRPRASMTSAPRSESSVESGTTCTMRPPLMTIARSGSVVAVRVSSTVACLTISARSRGVALAAAAPSARPHAAIHAHPASKPARSLCTPRQLEMTSLRHRTRVIPSLLSPQRLQHAHPVSAHDLLDVTARELRLLERRVEREHPRDRVELRDNDVRRRPVEAHDPSPPHGFPPGHVVRDAFRVVVPDRHETRLA